MQEPAVSPLPTHNSNSSHLSPLVIPTEVEGSVVRHASLSNLPWQDSTTAPDPSAPDIEGHAAIKAGETGCFLS